MAKKKRKKRPSPPQRTTSTSTPKAVRAPRKAAGPAEVPSPIIPGWLTPAVVVACCLFVFWQMKPGLLFASNIPTGGDLGSQVWGPAVLKNAILPAFSGWSPQWFGGLAAYVRMDQSSADPG